MSEIAGIPKETRGVKHMVGLAKTLIAVAGVTIILGVLPNATAEAQEACSVTGSGVYIRQGPGREYGYMTAGLNGTLPADGVVINDNRERWIRLSQDQGYVAEWVTTNSGCPQLGADVATGIVAVQPEAQGNVIELSGARLQPYDIYSTNTRSVYHGPEWIFDQTVLTSGTTLNFTGTMFDGSPSFGAWLMQHITFTGQRVNFMGRECVTQSSGFQYYSAANRNPLGRAMLEFPMAQGSQHFLITSADAGGDNKMIAVLVCN